MDHDGDVWLTNVILFIYGVICLAQSWKTLCLVPDLARLTDFDSAFAGNGQADIQLVSGYLFRLSEDDPRLSHSATYFSGPPALLNIAKWLCLRHAVSLGGMIGIGREVSAVWPLLASFDRGSPPGLSLIALGVGQGGGTHQSLFLRLFLLLSSCFLDGPDTRSPAHCCATTPATWALLWLHFMLRLPASLSLPAPFCYF